MAKFKDLSLDLETGEHIDFDDADTIKMGYDGSELYISSTVSGVRAAQPYHIVRYDQLTESSGTLQIDIDTINQIFADMKEPTGFVNRTDSSYSFNNGNRTFTISGTYSYYIKGIEFEKDGSDSVQIPDNEGTHIIYFDGDTLLSTEIFTPILITEFALVAGVYWDNTNDVQIWLGDERHGMTMDGRTHLYLHNTVGTAWETGLALTDIIATGNGSQDSHAQFGYSLGVIWDEDIAFPIPGQAGPAIWDVFYKEGPASKWKSDQVTSFPVKIFPGGRLARNENVGGTWQQTEITNGRFLLTHIFATDDLDRPMIAVQGEIEYQNIPAARTAAPDELFNITAGDMPFTEFSAIASVIYETKDNFANAVEARIVQTDEGDDYIDFRENQQGGGGATTSDHGSLSGLSDDDHPHYLTRTDFTTYSGTMDAEWTAADTALDIKIDTTSGTLQDQIDEIDFLELPDTPTTYSGYGTYSVAVRVDETGLEFTEVSVSGVGRAGQYDIADATDSFTVIFDKDLETTTYYLVGSLENQVDGDPAKYGFNISNTTVSGFDIELSDITDSANYKFNYTAVDANVEAVGIPIPGPQGETGVSGTQGDQGLQGDPGVTSTSGFAGQYDIPDVTESFTVDFTYNMADIDYYVVGTVENQTDIETAKYGFNIVNTTLSGFGVDLSDITDSANYKFNWMAVAIPTESIGIPIPGPQGETGASGIQGEQGPQGESGTTTASGVSGQYYIPNGVDSFTVDFGLDLETEDYYLVGSMENQIDPEPAKYGFNIFNTTVSGFSIELSDITDSGNYKFNFAAMVYGDVNTIGIIVPGPQGIQGIQGEQGETGPTASGGIESDSNPTLGGDVDMNGHSIILTPEPTNDQTAVGMVVYMTVDVNDQGFGAPLYMASDGNLEMANASSTATMPCVVMALESGIGLMECCLIGFVRNDAWNWTSLGGTEGLIYISTISGILTQTLASGTGEQVQVVGYATHADRMYFNPQLPMVELA